MRTSAKILVFIFVAFYVKAQVSGPLTETISAKRTSRETVAIDHKNIYQSLEATRNSRSPKLVQLPVYGTLRSFNAVENRVMEGVGRDPSMSSIRTFDIYAEDDPSLNGALTVSPEAVYVTLLSKKQMVSIYPVEYGKSDQYVVEYGIQPDLPRTSMACGHDHSHADMTRKASPAGESRLTGITIGSERYNYRVAIVTTGEFYVANGNNDSQVNNVVVSSVNGISAIFRNEMSFTLSIGSRIFLYRIPASDPFTPDMMGGEGRTTQAGKVVPMHFSTTSYDIGHVFHNHVADDGWSSGGVAQLQSVCDNFVFGGGQLAKASAWSGAFENQGNGWISLAAHEFGHQFGANHTFNGIGNDCTDNIAEHNSVEIGSGTTIMSYNGICDAAQNIPSGDELDNYFHINSLTEMYEYVYNGEGGTCGNPVIANNPLPQVIANPCQSTHFLPKGTPFYLKAQGSFTDGDTHTYCWEQTDEDGATITPTQGFIGTQAGNSTIAPLFRSYPPSTSPERYFPSLDILSSGAINYFEPLPNVPREINFNVTIRDNNPSGGAAASDNLKITVMNAGPMVVERPAGGENFQAGMSEQIVWAVNGSSGLCQNVRIRLSNDGGKSYPIVLAENVPYVAGSYFYQVPSNIVRTTTARIMIECMDNDCFRFFNVSASNFTINSTCVAEESALCPTTKVSQDEGSPALNLLMTKTIGDRIYSLTRQINENLPTGNVSVKGVGGVGCDAVSNNYYYSRINIHVTETGTYFFNIEGSGFASVFRSNFNANSACSSFVTSSATSTGTGSLTRTPGFSATLTQCTDYVLVLYSFSQLPQNLKFTVLSGPGMVLEKATTPSASYQNVFLLVNDVNGQIAFAGNNTDLTAVPAGNYTLYSVVMDKNIVLTTLVGTSYSALKNTACINESLNSRAVEIKTSCKISDITAASQGACVAATNQFTQDVVVTYSKPPADGKLRVNGQDFDITGSPQTVTLTGMDSDGMMVSVTALFTDAPACSFSKPNLFQAPTNCCPAVVELGTDKTACAGQNLTLDAGTTGASYKWFRNGVEIMGQTQNTLQVSSDGNYEVLVTHASGCSRRDNVNVSFFANPTVTLPASTTFCTGDTYVIEPSVSGGTSYKWFKDNVLITGESSATLSITQAGSYKVEVTGQGGCSSTAQTSATLLPKPTVELGDTQAKCEGETVTLNAGTGGAIYQWFRDGTLLPTAVSPTLQVTQSGIYRVVVTAANQCMSEDNVKIDFFASPVVQDLPQMVNICQGDSTTLMAMASDYQSLQWYYEGNMIFGSTGLTLKVKNSGMYSIEASNLAGCKTRKSTEVNVRSKPVVDLGSDVTACIGSSLDLKAGSEGTSYMWTKDGVAVSNATNTLTVIQSGTYAVTVTNQYSCVSTDQVNITFSPGPNVQLNGDKTICEGTNHDIVVTTNAMSPLIKWYRNGNIIQGESSGTLTVNQEGTYEVLLTGGTPPCEVKKSVVIMVTPGPAFNLGNDRTLCEGDTYPVLNAGAGNTSYAWTLNGAPLSSAQTVTADKSGTYSVKVTNSFGCEKTEQVKITIEPLPTLVMDTTYNLCTGKTLTVTPTTNGTKFVWKKSGTAISGETAKTINLTTGGMYSFATFNAANCKREQNFTVTSRPAPTVNLGVDQKLCPDKSVTLDAGPQDNYLWSDNSTQRTLMVDAGKPASEMTKNYAVTVTNQFGCTDSDTISVVLYAAVKAAVTADKPGVCNGEPVTLTAAGGATYKWTDPDGNTLSATDKAVTIASPTKTTIYTVEVGDTNCPENKELKNIEIKVFEPVNISAGSDTCVVIGKSIRLKASGGVFYQWDNASLITGPSNVSDPIVTPVTETIFTVTITDSNGCEFTDQVTVCVKEDTFKPVSIITPNGDGKNDELYFGGLSDYPDNTLRIFNRWGNLIFEAEGYQVYGDLFKGLRNGDRLPADTYYYILTFDNRVIKSSLTILWD